jgi:hypothetical protein
MAAVAAAGMTAYAADIGPISNECDDLEATSENPGDRSDTLH